MKKNRVTDQLTRLVRPDSKLPWIKFENKIFVEVGHVQMSNTSKEDLVDLIDNAECDGISNFFVFFNKDRTDLKSICKNLTFIGFLPILRQKVERFFEDVNLNGDNVYMNYSLDGSEEDDLIDFD